MLRASHRVNLFCRAMTGGKVLEAPQGLCERAFQSSRVRYMRIKTETIAIATLSVSIFPPVDTRGALMPFVHIHV